MTYLSLFEASAYAYTLLIAGAQRAAASENVIARLLAKGPLDKPSSGDACKDDGSLLDHRRLSTLRLHGMNLSKVSRLLPKAVDIPHLTSLSLHRCEDDTLFLCVLAGEEHRQGGKLRNLAIIKSAKAQPEWGGERFINDFLQSFDTRETLIISAPRTQALASSLNAMANRGNLRVLYLDCKPGQFIETYEWRALDELRHSKKLEQLALNLPFTVLGLNDYSKSEELSCFLVRFQAEWRL